MPSKRSETTVSVPNVAQTGCHAWRRRRNAADVVGVLVGDEYRVERRRREAQAAEALLRVANAEPAIDQDPRAPRLDDEAIAFAAAA
jgi:hypothetical protein